MQSLVEPAAKGTALDPAWSRVKRIGFRFAALYFALYFFPTPLASLFRSPEQIDGYTALTAKLWDPFVNVVAHALGVQAHLSLAPPRFSNDGRADYVQLVCFALVAAALALVWSIADRARPEERPHALLRAWLRYTLAATILAYGFAKVFPQQMALPEPSVLLTPYGRSHPMTLLWTFMGAAPAYEIFAGVAEVAGGILLLSRRTTALGALVVAAVMANVVMMNLCYGVYLKQFTLNLLALALFVLLPSTRRLLDALALGRAVPAEKTDEPLLHSWPRSRPWVKGAVICCILYSQCAPCVHHYFVDQDGAPLPDLYGIYDVDEMRRDGEVAAPLLTDPKYWQHLYFGRRASGITFGDGSRVGLTVARGEGRDTWSLKRDGATLSLVRSEDGRLVIEGVIDGRNVVVHARPTDEKNLRLVRSPFHWVTEL